MGTILSEELVSRVCGDPVFPRMGLIEQQWSTDPVPEDGIPDRVRTAVGSLGLEALETGSTVALGVGSRGIAYIPTIVRTAVEAVRERGLEPIVVPAMGSHGGATAEGQTEKLESLGITPESIGCPIEATMDVTTIGRTDEHDIPVRIDEIVARADAIVPINRVKPHTDFQGDVESGIAKMLVIGMGNQTGAKATHEWAVEVGFETAIREMAAHLLEELPVAGGIAIVEDENDETATIDGVPASDLFGREADLLRRAYEHLPQIPFDDIDVLVVDRMGKEISGAGMDTNVIGRLDEVKRQSPKRPTVKRIFVRSLTETSGGNADGFGVADFIHQDLLSAADLEKTLTNSLTSGAVRGSRIPPTVENDRAGLIASLSTIGPPDPERDRVVRITDTMHLRRLYVSAALIEEARDREDLEVVLEPADIAFTAEGNFADPSAADR